MIATTKQNFKNTVHTFSSAAEKLHILITQLLIFENGFHQPHV